MLDKYEYILTRGGSFTAGYGLCKLSQCRTMGAQFLFTTLRVLRVRKGRAVWQIGSKAVSISPGDIIIVNNVEARRFLSVEEEFSGEIFAFLPSIFGSNVECLRLFYGRSASFKPCIDRTLACFDEVNRLLDITAEAFSSREDEVRGVLISSLLITMTALLLRSIATEQPDAFIPMDSLNRDAVSIIVETFRYINDHISEEFGVSELAAHVNLSRCYYSRIFRSMTGTTPGTFLARCRVQNAVRLMLIGSYNILDAAMLSGFGSSSGFYKTFSAVCGIPPSKYLRNICGISP